MFESKKTEVSFISVSSTYYYKTHLTKGKQDECAVFVMVDEDA